MILHDPFQSTHPHGVRHFGICACGSFPVVSIHAPARGATRPDSGFFRAFEFQSTHPHGVRLISQLNEDGTLQFQSTHPHGVRLLIVHRLDDLIEFQSTHPHGVRLFFKVDKGRIRRFNPRTRTGCDKYDADSIFNKYGFQSTHPHGVRHLYEACSCIVEQVSIHAPARGATQNDPG